MIVNQVTMQKYLTDNPGGEAELFALVSQPAYHTLMILRLGELRDELLSLDYAKDEQLSMIYRRLRNELQDLEQTMKFVSSFKERIQKPS